eukprot:Skav207996  [mRNA]  locus=scaffold1203:150111:150970:+ [translate_table: standard]
MGCLSHWSEDIFSLRTPRADPQQTKAPGPPTTPSSISEPTEDQKFSGSLLKDLTPPVNPPKAALGPAMVKDGKLASQPHQEIDDPSDSKPADWVDEAKMDDPEAFKPAAERQAEE